MRYKIAVFDNRLLPGAQSQIQDLFGTTIVFPKDRCLSEAELIKRTGDADIILAGPWDKVTKRFLDACPRVKYVCLCGTSTANIDMNELRDRGIAFSNVVGYGDAPTAEFIMMELTMLLRGIGKHQWREAQHELMGKSIGIIGLGALGKSIAHLALAYKMKVTYYSPNRKPEWEDRGLEYAEIPKLLESSDMIICSGPTDVEVIGAAEFAQIRPGSVIVQVSSGKVIEERSFLAWIARDGNFAIFDRAAGEHAFNIYRDLPRVIFAPVIAGDTHETLERLGLKVYENLNTYLESR